MWFNGAIVPPARFISREAFAMADRNQFTPPYRPFFLHAFIDGLYRLPIPAWLIYFLVLTVLGLGQHLYAWNIGALPRGAVNMDLAFSSLWVIITLVVWRHMSSRAGMALDQYRPYLGLDDRAFAELRYRFVTLPLGIGLPAIVFGIFAGWSSAQTDMLVAPPVQYIVPPIRITIWILTNVFIVPAAIQLFRQVQLMHSVFLQTERIDLFDLHPLYAFSKYTAVVCVLGFFSSAVLPLIVNPTAYEASGLLATGVTIAVIASLIYFYSLFGVNRQLVSRKRQVLREADERMEAMFQRIHAAFESENYSQAPGLRDMLGALQDERAAIRGTRTWPWEPGTLSWFGSALLIPILITVLRDYIAQLLGF